MDLLTILINVHITHLFCINHVTFQERMRHRAALLSLQLGSSIYTFFILSNPLTTLNFPLIATQSCLWVSRNCMKRNFMWHNLLGYLKRTLKLLIFVRTNPFPIFKDQEFNMIFPEKINHNKHAFAIFLPGKKPQKIHFFVDRTLKCEQYSSLI